MKQLFNDMKSCSLLEKYMIAPPLLTAVLLMKRNVLLSMTYKTEDPNKTIAPPSYYPVLSVYSTCDPL